MGEVIVRASALPGAARRFTGSYEAGSGNPDLLPISSWMFDPVPAIDTSSWSLRAPGRPWTYEQLYSFDDRLTATLDCTGGFYSTQDWAGVRLDRLIGDASGASSRIVSHTGYDARFAVSCASNLLLPKRTGRPRRVP